MGRLVIVIVNGLPCTGKTGTWRFVGGRTGFRMHSKDEVIEPMLADLAADDSNLVQIRNEAYERIWREMGEDLADGKSVILDANLNQAEHAEAILQLAATYNATIVYLHCDMPVELAAERFIARQNDPHTARARSNHRRAKNLEDYKKLYYYGKQIDLDLPGANVCYLDFSDYGRGEAYHQMALQFVLRIAHMPLATH